MAYESGSNVFISFRYKDGHEEKDKLVELFDESPKINDRSESEDRSQLSEESIRNYLYDKLRNTSVTVVLLTPEAINYQKNIFGKYDDWIYDEVRFSLEDRNSDRTNALIGVYTSSAQNMLFSVEPHKCEYCDGYDCRCLKDVDNLVRQNQCNVKVAFKKRLCHGIYSEEDSYASLVSWNDFINNPQEYIKEAKEKRERYLKNNEFNIVKRMPDDNYTMY